MRQIQDFSKFIVSLMRQSVKGMAYFLCNFLRRKCYGTDKMPGM
nr:MAG TPA: hypothetical protein [Caudoviricetes sp.]